MLYGGGVVGPFVVPIVGGIHPFSQVEMLVVVVVVVGTGVSIKNFSGSPLSCLTSISSGPLQKFFAAEKAIRTAANVKNPSTVFICLNVFLGRFLF